jgi:hypothetical protein
VRRRGRRREARPGADHPRHEDGALAGVRGGGAGRDLFAAAERLHLEGIVAKRKTDAYALGTVWFKIKNGAYTQMEGRGELFHPPRR